MKTSLYWDFISQKQSNLAVCVMILQSSNYFKACIDNVVDGIFSLAHKSYMAWEVEYTDEFFEWWSSLTEGEQDSVAHHVKLLEEKGVHLKHPFCSKVFESKHTNMRELRPQHEGRPYRVLYAFDPRRVAILLIGGDKTGNDRWYEIFIPLADKIYDAHLKEIGE